jgi:hypothetical protein
VHGYCLAQRGYCRAVRGYCRVVRGYYCAGQLDVLHTSAGKWFIFQWPQRH